MIVVDGLPAEMIAVPAPHAPVALLKVTLALFVTVKSPGAVEPHVAAVPPAGAPPIVKGIVTS